MNRFVESSLIAATALVLLGVLAFPAMADEKKDKNAAYAIALDSGAVAVGKDGKLTLAITAGKGYKWNKQFPASFKITTTGEAANVANKDFRAPAFKTEGKTTAVQVPIAGASSGQTTLEGKVRFSVCNEEACIVKSETVRATIQVD